MLLWDSTTPGPQSREGGLGIVGCDRPGFEAEKQDPGSRIILMLIKAIPLITSAGLTCVVGLLLIRRALALGFIDHPGNRKVHTVPTPRTGGIAMAAGTLCTIILTRSFSLILPSAVPWQTLCAGLGFTLLGALDDRFSYAPKHKFLVFLAFSTLATWPWMVLTQTHSFPGIHVGSLLIQVPAPVLFLLITLWFMALPNAVNIEDAINGYMGGFTLILLVAMGLRGLNVWIPAGALAGFLIMNWPRAKHFMGDAGSFGCGFLLAETILRSGGISNPLLALVWTAPISMDVAMGLLRRHRQKMGFFEPDQRTLPHHLLGLAGGNPLLATPPLWLNCIAFILVSDRPLGALVLAIAYGAVLVYFNRTFLFNRVPSQRFGA
jgi:UDP-GlcNAc:undecaprenyl-phosphate GlcNAc-1-phosphate transferase